MQHEAEMREKELELKRKLEEEDAAQRKLAEQRAGKGVGMTGEHALSRVNGVDLHKQLENLLAGTARVVLSESSSVKKTNQPSSFATDQESSSSKKYVKLVYINPALESHLVDHTRHLENWGVSFFFNGHL